MGGPGTHLLAHQGPSVTPVTVHGIRAVGPHHPSCCLRWGGRLSHPITILPSACPNPAPASFPKALGSSGHQACSWPGVQQGTPSLSHPCGLPASCPHMGLSMSLPPLPPQARLAAVAQHLSGAGQSVGAAGPGAGQARAGSAWGGGQLAQSGWGRACEMHFIGSQENKIRSGHRQNLGTGPEGQGAGPGQASVSLRNDVNAGSTGQLPGASLGEGWHVGRVAGQCP